MNYAARVKPPTYRVVYGETRPAWEQIFPSLREARNFARRHKNIGDRIFSTAATVEGEPPQSLMALIKASQ